MEKEKLTIIKVGGKIVEDAAALDNLLSKFAAIEGNKILVHGGGQTATDMASSLNIETKMVRGRRITDENMLRIVTMVYGGLVNKNIVAKLYSKGVQALGVTGADCNIIHSHRRPVIDIDYGFVGDVDAVNSEMLATIINAGITPVIAPLTHDGKGNILNTNADTIAGEVAKAMSQKFDVTLVFCFEKKGVLSDENDETSIIPVIRRSDFNNLIEKGIISGGMIPKIQNSLDAVDKGVTKVVITSAQNLNIETGTQIIR